MAVLNRKELLATTLEGYARYPRYEDTELVITDYGSTDNLEGLLERASSIFGRVRYLVIDRSKSFIPINPAFNNPAVTLNVGVRAAVAPLIIMTPPECYPLTDTVRAAQEIMRLGNGGLRDACLIGKAMGQYEEDAGMVQKGKWLPRTETELREGIPSNRLTVYASENVRRPVPFFIALRKQDHERLNGFDEEYVRGYAAEDTDYTTRLLKITAENLWDNRCTVLHQWHPRIAPGGKGTAPGRPNYKRDGVKANLSHEPGSPELIAKDVVL